MDLLEILNYWSFWDRELPKNISRKIALPKKLDAELPLVIQGVRRCGKSTLMIQLIDYYKLNKKNCAFINFEDPELLNSLAIELLDEIVNAFRSLRGKSKKLYFFLDEIQEVPNWQKWILKQVERPSNNFFIISGSNSNLLSGELGSTLTGRYFNIELFPFSFFEVQKTLGLSLDEYLEYGGFPRVLIDRNKNLLKNYFNNIVDKDVILRANLRNSNNLKKTLQLAYESVGSEVSYNSLAGTVGVNTSSTSSYIDISKSAYLLFECPYFSYSTKKSEVRNKKFYCIDPGLRKAVIRKSGSLDQGKSFENIVYLELKRKYKNVYYWRGKKEVDFVILENGFTTPIQVSIDSIKERHELALEEFYNNFPHANQPIFITRDNFNLFED